MNPYQSDKFDDLMEKIVERKPTESGVRLNKYAEKLKKLDAIENMIEI